MRIDLYAKRPASILLRAPLAVVSPQSPRLASLTLVYSIPFLNFERKTDGMQSTRPYIVLSAEESNTTSGPPVDEPALESFALQNRGSCSATFVNAKGKISSGIKDLEVLWQKASIYSLY